MHKRILCLILAALLLLSLIPSIALPSQAASNMKTSERCIEILKAMEGFVKYPMADHGQYSVGYGSACDPEDYPDGITEEEADALMREYLADMEKELNSFANRYHILFSQHQFDALMLFTYNCGTNWVNSDGEFRKAVIENKTGNSYIYPLTLWTTAGGQLHLGLVNRRLIEADMYLNGSYENVCPSNYTYILYDNNGGLAQARVQGYDCNLPACVKSLPTREGYTFLGWYTALEGGSWITELTSQNAEQTLYAHWQSSDVVPSMGTPASYQVGADALASLDTYDAPNGKNVGLLNQRAIAEVTADYVDAAGMKWGRIRNGTWVKLGDPRIGTFDETEPVVGVEVTVTGDYVNVRTGPGTDYQIVSGVLRGDVLLITETVSVNGDLWGRFRGGWLALEYTNYAGGLTPGEPDVVIPGDQTGADTVIATGTVTADGLNIRATAGTHGYLMGCYQKGEKVEILEKTMVGGTPWGRTDRGWICLTFVKLDEPAQEQPEETTKPTEPETSVPETTAPETEETKPETDQEESVQRGIPATVTSKNGLNIRKGPGTQYANVGSYASGEKIHILAQTTVSGAAWGRTDKGWVCMQYVQLSDSWSNENGVYGVVTSATGLNIRSGAGVGYAPIGSYQAGQRILVFQQVVVAGQKWGRTDEGWVCMTYVKLEESASGTDKPTEPEAPQETTKPGETTKPEEIRVLTGTVTAGGLNIRSTPGTDGAIVGGYQRGDRVTIVEQKQVNGTAWGRTDRGWICLAYVKLDNTGDDMPEAGYSGVITADVLCIRKGPGTGNAIVGTYKQGQQVIILETVKVGATAWGRTNLGWICMDYVK